MNPKKNPRRAASLVVATAHTGKGLRQAGRLRPGDVGFIEVRLDELGSDEPRLKAGLESIRVPVLLTARHPAEGGGMRLSLAERRSLLQEFLLKASAVDVELRSVALMPAVLEIARRRKIKRVLSFHDFRGTPSLPRLREVVRRGTRAGADVVKIATHLRSANDLAVLLLLQSTTKVPLATMGMGPLGKVSRLVLAAAGSRLNYGYLDKPQVSGQWPALELVERLEEVLP
jgi:3-dehydroquinate dehydratase I